MGSSTIQQQAVGEAAEWPADDGRGHGQDGDKSEILRHAARKRRRISTCQMGADICLLSGNVYLVRDKRFVCPGDIISSLSLGTLGLLIYNILRQMTNVLYL